MKTDLTPLELEQITKDAQTLSEETQALVDTLFQQSKGMHLGDVHLDDQVHMLKLMLQYRLDSQNLLNQLMGIERGLLAILGVGPQYSSKINLERLSFALGGEELKQLLFALGQLISVLQKLLYEEAQKKKALTEKEREKALKAAQKYREAESTLNKATKKQHQLMSTIEKLEHFLKHFVKHEAKGQMLNHIGALQGPVSRFHQAVQSGLGITKQVSTLFSKQANLPLSVNDLVKKAETLAKKAEHKNPSLFSDAKPAPTNDLEQRAEDKRLGDFFNH